MLLDRLFYHTVEFSKMGASTPEGKKTWDDVEWRKTCFVGPVIRIQ